MKKTGKTKLFKPQCHLILIVIPIENENIISNYGIEIPEGYSIIGNNIIPKYNGIEKDNSVTYLLNERSVIAEQYIDENKKLFYPYPGRIKH